MKKLLLSTIVATLVAGGAQARDQLSMAGSSTVLPFATIIAEEMGKNPQFKTPVVDQVAHLSGKKGYVKGSAHNLSISVMPLHG